VSGRTTATPAWNFISAVVDSRTRQEVHRCVNSYPAEWFTPLPAAPVIPATTPGIRTSFGVYCLAQRSDDIMAKFEPIDVWNVLVAAAVFPLRFAHTGTTTDEADVTRTAVDVTYDVTAMHPAIVSIRGSEQLADIICAFVAVYSHDITAAERDTLSLMIEARMTDVTCCSSTDTLNVNARRRYATIDYAPRSTVRQRLASAVGFLCPSRPTYVLTTCATK
jgi:hypothetical protein